MSARVSCQSNNITQEAPWYGTIRFDLCFVLCLQCMETMCTWTSDVDQHMINHPTNTTVHTCRNKFCLRSKRSLMNQANSGHAARLCSARTGTLVSLRTQSYFRLSPKIRLRSQVIPREAIQQINVSFSCVCTVIDHQFYITLSK